MTHRETSTPERAATRYAPASLLEHRVALGALVLAAVLFALVSLSYPHGRDQATHGYIGLRWLEGKIPYRDTFDIKPPGVFFAHTFAYAVFGESMFALRALDLLASVLPTGLVLAFATLPKDAVKAVRNRHVVRVAAFHTLIYFGTFDYWCTGQSETWCCVVASVAIHSAATESSRTRARSAFVQGLALGGMLLFKPPAVVIVLACIAFVLHAQRPHDRSLGAWVRHISTFGALSAAGVGLIVGPVLAYFALHQSLGAMFDVLVVTTARYAKTGSSAASLVDSIGEIFMMFATFNGLPLLLLAGAVVRSKSPGTTESARRRYRLGLLVFAGGVVAVGAQRKFFLYHWVLAVPALTFLAGSALADLHETIGTTGTERRFLPSQVTVLALVLLLVGGDGTDNVLRVASLLPELASAPKLESLDPAFVDPGHYHVDEYRTIARHVARISSANDDVLVRGFEPQIYLLAGRRYHGRHFWSLFVSGSVFSQPERFRDEDCRTFLSAPPKVVVAFNSDRPPIEAGPTYVRMGYRKVADVSVFVVLERDGSVALPETCPW